MMVANSAVAESDYNPLPLAPESTQSACSSQPPDDEKLLKALAFMISRRSGIVPVIGKYGEPASKDAPLLTVENPGAVLTAQPDCCWIAYEDHESQYAPYYREKLGSNFGGFAYARIGIRSTDGQYKGKIFYHWESYSLNACGYPVYIMSHD
jgi:hypothetical protein